MPRITKRIKSWSRTYGTGLGGFDILCIFFFGFFSFLNLGALRYYQREKKNFLSKRDHWDRDTKREIFVFIFFFKYVLQGSSSTFQVSRKSIYIFFKTNRTTRLLCSNTHKIPARSPSGTRPKIFKKKNSSFLSDENIKMQFGIKITQKSYAKISTNFWSI